MSQFGITYIVVNNSPPHFFPIPIDPADIDFMGHVNNASYLKWVQEAVIDHWRSFAPADAVAASIQAVTGRATTPSTSGGTSDGRFIATLGTQVVELGPVNATIHQINERVLASDLDLLTEVYYQTLVKLLA